MGLEFMSATIKLVTWNIGGAKFLKEPQATRIKLQEKINQGLHSVIRNVQPDILLLQEVVRFGSGSKVTEFIQPPAGYFYNGSIAIDTRSQSHPMKWRPYRSGGHWSKTDYLAQGLGMLWKKELKHAPLWEFEGAPGPDLEKEMVRLETGLYTGDRDTEPRLLVVSHFILDGVEKRQDIFVINLHLSTLKKEREGIPEMDARGSQIRLNQIGLILNGVIARHQEFSRQAVAARSRFPAVWIVAGDFNCTPDSAEIRTLKQNGFVDLNPRKGRGSKGKGFPDNRPEITVDYILAGQDAPALAVAQMQNVIPNNPEPFYEQTGSDHYPVFAEIGIQ
jgi:endonuclease/exonuclease/phosphatase family metal-dependent hydrolase